MTATDAAVLVTPPALLPVWQRLTALGTGFGIAVGARDLQIAIVRARPAGPSLVAETTIPDFRERPAAEWGAELAQFLNRTGESKLAATVLLPRHEVIVRTLHLPGVTDRDAAGAIELQIDTLHPYGDQEVAWGWSRTGAENVLVGIVPTQLLGTYETLFQEAGIPLAAVTFSPAAIYAALRIWNVAPAAILCWVPAGAKTEIYGESAAKPVYSAEFAMVGERAAALTRSELRLPLDYPAAALHEVLPFGGKAPESAVAYAAALVGAAAKAANLLPADRRASHDRLQYLAPAALGLVLVLALVTFFAIMPALEERRYREALNQAALQLEPTATRARNLERATSAARAKIAALDDFRHRPQLDLDSMNELTRLLTPPVWTNSIEFYPDSIVISGEADQAAPLLKLLDSSPLFQNSEFVSSVVRTAQKTEQFRIRTMRRGRTGRVTP